MSSSRPLITISFSSDNQVIAVSVTLYFLASIFIFSVSKLPDAFVSVNSAPATGLFFSSILLNVTSEAPVSSSFIISKRLLFSSNVTPIGS